ncbi:MAG TPA: ATP-dependent Clp protease adaptor ClpS [Ignavibacteria bacterium]|nr:ATP-dependent Clp protease adaptor ClpS [Ignavibacteria bacterium]HRJ98750.1 ATP-dependent Clp protease adaptor ClpS [Ignavibacteria bacterium]
MNSTITETEYNSTDKNAVLHKLILFNSNHIWDDVIIQLRKATGYSNIQCEQIAIIAHTRGKAVVSTGEIPKLNYINSVLKEINLITEIS